MSGYQHPPTLGIPPNMIEPSPSFSAVDNRLRQANRLIRRLFLTISVLVLTLGLIAIAGGVWQIRRALPGLCRGTSYDLAELGFRYRSDPQKLANALENGAKGTAVKQLAEYAQAAEVSQPWDLMIKIFGDSDDLINRAAGTPADTCWSGHQRPDPETYSVGDGVFYLFLYERTPVFAIRSAETPLRVGSPTVLRPATWLRPEPLHGEHYLTADCSPPPHEKPVRYC